MKINFTGKAYFLDNVSKKISREHKMRIENYADKLDKKTDIVVFGQEKEDKFVYQGVVYGQEKVSLDLSNIDDNNIGFKIATQNGVKCVSMDDVEIIKTSVPIYNAYILTENNKANICIPPYRKQFDFYNNAINVLLRPNGGSEKDSIEY